MKKLVQRDFNIEKHIRGEISLSTRRVPDKTKYTRKEKYARDYRRTI